MGHEHRGPAGPRPEGGAAREPTPAPRVPAIVRGTVAVAVLAAACSGEDDTGRRDENTEAGGQGGVIAPMVAPTGGSGGQIAPMVAPTGGSGGRAPMVNTGGMAVPMVPPMVVGAGGLIGPMAPPFQSYGGTFPVGQGGAIAPMPPPPPMPFPGQGGAIPPMPPPPMPAPAPNGSEPQD